MRIATRSERVAGVHAALRAAGVAFEPRQLDDNTATAVMAAAALGCEVAQIAKTVIFRDKADDSAIVTVLCGDDRVDTAKLAALIGGEGGAGAPGAVGKADADFVKLHCGYEIGGVSPLAHPRPLKVLLENRLQRFPQIWAAAGSAYAVFGIAPAALCSASNGTFADFAAPAPAPTS